MFEVRYIGKRNDAKWWIQDTANLTAMYHIFQPGSTVTIWCESIMKMIPLPLTLLATTTASSRRKCKVD